jgi:SAM-dependent methyltransferase
VTTGYAHAMDGPQSNAETASSKAVDPPPLYLEARAELAYRYLAGKGLEIGALNWPLDLPAGAEASTVDRMTLEELREEYPELAGRELAKVDIIDDGERLVSIPDVSQDFIVANHFLEHTEDPIGTIKTHLGKLKPGGVLFYAVPDKRYTFDVRRQTTPVEHVIRDHEEGPEGSRAEHYDEWVLLAEESPYDREDAIFPEHAEMYSRDLEASGFSIHFHVWTGSTFLEFLLECRRRLEEGFEIEATCRRGIELVVVLRKAGALPNPAMPGVTAPDLAAEVRRMRTQVSQLERELETTSRELQFVKQSSSWRMTEPLRSAKARLGRRR